MRNNTPKNVLNPTGVIVYIIFAPLYLKHLKQGELCHISPEELFGTFVMLKLHFNLEMFESSFLVYQLLHPSPTSGKWLCVSSQQI